MKDRIYLAAISARQFLEDVLTEPRAMLGDLSSLARGGR